MHQMQTWLLTCGLVPGGALTHMLHTIAIARSSEQANKGSYLRSAGLNCDTCLENFF